MMILVLPRLAVSSRAISPEMEMTAQVAAAPTLEAPPEPAVLPPAGAPAAAPDAAAPPPQNEAAAAVPPAGNMSAAAALPELTLAPFDIPFAEPPTSPPAEQPVVPVAPDLQSFVASVTNGDASTVTGLYAEGLFALQVRQQPPTDINYISDEIGTVTQYSQPAQFGVTGLLAHNTLSGKQFFRLRKDGELILVYGDGRLERYRIRDVQNYQALSPYDTRSDFVDLNHPGAPILSHNDLYQRVYTTPETLVLQTCIEANGEPTWGRLFIIADPI